MSDRKQKQSAKQTTSAARLKALRQKARLTRGYIEKQYGLPAVTLKAWENGTAKLTEKGLQRCIDIYRKEGVLLTAEWIQTGIGLPPKISVDIGRYFASDHAYPLRTPSSQFVIKDMDQPLPYGKSDQLDMLREASFFKESYPDAVVLMVTNDDMGPVFQTGDCVGGRFRYADAIDTVLKRDCIVRIKNTGQDVLRRVFKSRTGKGYNLVCINPMPTADEPIMFNVEIECAAPVIWHRMPNN